MGVEASELDLGFEAFVEELRPRLTRAFAGSHGPDQAVDIAADAVVWAWEHWEEVRRMGNPGGYLYRVGQSRARQRRRPVLPRVDAVDAPEVEPDLVPALLALPRSQRTAVWLVHACGWSYAEVAEAMGTSASTVGNHVSKALRRLRRRLEVTPDA